MNDFRRKTCRTCGQTYVLRMFYKHPTYSDGYMNDCKPCKRAYQKANHEAKQEQVRAYKKQWAARPENVAKRKAYAQSERGRAVHREACRFYNRFKKLEQRA